MTPLAGYGETYGQERVLETFQTFLAAMDQNASQLKLTDANIGQFLNFFLEQHEGGMPSELDMEDNSEPEGTFPSLPCLLKCPRARLQHPAMQVLVSMFTYHGTFIPVPEQLLRQLCDMYGTLPRPAYALAQQCTRSWRPIGLWWQGQHISTPAEMSPAEQLTSAFYCFDFSEPIAVHRVQLPSAGCPQTGPLQYSSTT